MALEVVVTGLTVPLVLCSVALAIVLIVLLILCGDKNKGDDAEPQLVHQVHTNEPAKASPVCPDEVVIEEETGEVTKRKSNCSAIGGGSQRNSSQSTQRNSAQQSNGVVENGVHTESIRKSTENSVPADCEDDEDDYDHIQRKTFQPKSNPGNKYNKVSLGAEAPVVEIDPADPYSKVKVDTSANGEEGADDDCDEDYATVDSPSTENAGFDNCYSTADKTQQVEGNNRVEEEEDFDGNYATVDKNKMTDVKPVRPVVEDEEETYSVVTPPPVPEKNFDFNEPQTYTGVTDATPSTASAVSLLPTAGSTPAIRPLDPEPPYSAVTARESLESIRQRKSAAASEVEEDYYQTVGGESGDGTITAKANRNSMSSDLYDEIKGDSSMDGVAPPPPVDVAHLKKLTNSTKRSNQPPTNVVEDEPGQLYAQVNKKTKRNSANTDGSQDPKPSAGPRSRAAYESVHINDETAKPIVNRLCYEEVDMDKVDNDRASALSNNVDEPEEFDPNYDTVLERDINAAGGASGGVSPNKETEDSIVPDYETVQRQDDKVTRIQIGQYDNVTELNRARRGHQYEDIDKTKKKEPILHCDMVTRI